MKRGHWHSSLGFGGVEDPQSRRHSFADVPARAGFRKPSLIGFQSNDSLNGIAEGQEIPAVYGMRRRRASQMSSYESGMIQISSFSSNDTVASSLLFAGKKKIEIFLQMAAIHRYICLYFRSVGLKVFLLTILP